MEPMYDSYPSEGNMEEEDQLVNSHDDMVVDVVQEILEQIQDNFDAFDFQWLENIHSLFPA